MPLGEGPFVNTELPQLFATLGVVGAGGTFLTTTSAELDFKDHTLVLLFLALR